MCLSNFSFAILLLIFYLYVLNSNLSQFINNKFHHSSYKVVLTSFFIKILNTSKSIISVVIFSKRLSIIWYSACSKSSFFDHQYWVYIFICWYIQCGSKLPVWLIFFDRITNAWRSYYYLIIFFVFWLNTNSYRLKISEFGKFYVSNLLWSI